MTMRLFRLGLDPSKVRVDAGENGGSLALAEFLGQPFGGGTGPFYRIASIESAAKWYHISHHRARTRGISERNPVIAIDSMKQAKQGALTDSAAVFKIVKTATPFLVGECIWEHPLARRPALHDGTNFILMGGCPFVISLAYLISILLILLSIFSQNGISPSEIPSVVFPINLLLVFDVMLLLVLNNLVFVCLVVGFLALVYFCLVPAPCYLLTRAANALHPIGLRLVSIKVRWSSGFVCFTLRTMLCQGCHVSLHKGLNSIVSRVGGLLWKQPFQSGDQPLLAHVYCITEYTYFSLQFGENPT